MSLTSLNKELTVNFLQNQTKQASKAHYAGPPVKMKKNHAMERSVYGKADNWQNLLVE